MPPIFIKGDEMGDKEVKCNYCCNKGIKSEMTSVNSTTTKGNVKKLNYHSECLELKIARDKAVEIFYEYTGSYEPLKNLYLTFKKIKEKGLNEKHILYTMQYIKDTKSVLRYPMGILYYLDRAMKEFKRTEQVRKANIQKEVPKETNGIVTEETELIENNKKEDECDISDFI